MRAGSVPRHSPLLASVAALRPDIERFLASRRKGRDDDNGLQDEVQVTITTAIANLSRYREDEGDLKSWVLGIAANVAKRAERERKRTGLITVGSAVPVYSPKVSPEYFARMYELRQKVGHVLQAMPEPLFAVLYLVCIEENSHRETAEMLGITEETSRKRLQDARAYVERESGLSRDDLRAAFPFCVASEEEEEEDTSLQGKLSFFLHRGGEFMVLWIIAALSWPSPSVHTALAGFAMPAAHMATAESTRAATEIVPALCIDVPAPSSSPSSAKVSAKPPAARPKPAGPVEAARGTAPATTEEPFVDKVTEHEFLRR